MEGKVQVEVEIEDPPFTAHTPVWVSGGREGKIQVEDEVNLRLPSSPVFSKLKGISNLPNVLYSIEHRAWSTAH